MTEQFDYVVCMEEYKDGTHRTYPCYAPSSLSIKEGDMVTIEDLEPRWACTTEGETFGCDIKRKKHGLKVIRRGGTITVNEDVDSALSPLRKIIYKYEDVYGEETE